jgi:pimeloyl-ACP methyl ester carboxylesterase
VPTPEPIYFGPVGQALFGWLHRARDDGPAPFGVVVCAPFGYEEACAHRPLRALATRCAAAGLPTLRHDPPGCGDSAGDDLHDITLERWVAAAHDAVQALRRATGVPRVVLLGMRIGAALAWQAAAARDDIAGIVCIAPVLDGHAWLRELRLLGETAPGAGSAQDGLLESAGFALDAAGQASFGALDLRHPERPPAPRVLLVPRDDVPTDDPHAAATLRALGAAVEVGRWPGYAELMTDPQRARLAPALADGIVTTLRRWADATPPPQRAVALPAAAASALHPVDTPQGRVLVRESAAWIERGAARLFGILAVPEPVDGGAPARGGPAVLLLNAGSVHHIGPGRLWVRLARRWAARGLTVLRLDLAGLGDSPGTLTGEDNAFYPPHALDDIRAAVEWLRRVAGAGEVHLLGLCSGAYHAYRAAAAGLPVGSAVMVNPLTFRWRNGTQLAVELVDSDVIRMTRRYRAAVARADTWRRLVQGDLDLPMIVRALAVRVYNGLRRRMRALVRWIGLVPDDDVAAALARAAGAGIRLRFVFAAGEPGLELLQAETGHALKPLLASGKVVLETLVDADHTFTRLEARDRLVALLDRWAFALGAPARTATAPAAAAPTLRRGQRAA